MEISSEISSPKALSSTRLSPDCAAAELRNISANKADLLLSVQEGITKFPRFYWENYI